MKWYVHEQTLRVTCFAAAVFTKPVRNPRVAHCRTLKGQADRIMMTSFPLVSSSVTTKLSLGSPAKDENELVTADSLL